MFCIAVERLSSLKMEFLFPSLSITRISLFSFTLGVDFIERD